MNHDHHFLYTLYPKGQFFGLIYPTPYRYLLPLPVTMNFLQSQFRLLSGLNQQVQKNLKLPYQKVISRLIIKGFSLLCKYIRFVPFNSSIFWNMVFLTGGSGFLGSYFLYYLLRDNKEVRALKRQTSNLKYTHLIFKYLSEFEPLPGGETWEQALERVDWVEGDILDMYSLLDAFEGVDIVYDTA